MIHHEGTKNTKEDTENTGNRLFSSTASASVSRVGWVKREEVPFCRSETRVPASSVPFVVRITQAIND